MQPSPPPSSFRLPPAESRRPAAGNEFSVAVTRLVERRSRFPERAVVLPRLDASEGFDDAPPDRTGAVVLAKRVGLLAVAVVPAGFALAWLLGGAGTPPEPPVPPAARTARSLSPGAAVPAPAAASQREADIHPTHGKAPPVEATVAGPPPPDLPRAEPPRPDPPRPDPLRPEPRRSDAAPIAAPLTRDEVREAQGRLSALGFAAGPADGVAGPQTQAAVRRYAEARRLPGRDLDRAVLQRLRADGPGPR